MQSTHPEIWKPVVGYEGLYEVSSKGRVRSLPRVFARGATRGEVVLRPTIRRGRNGRVEKLSVGLTKANVCTTHLVHHLVLTAFSGPRPLGTEACHGNGNAADNRVENLRWDTHSVNEIDKVRHGTHNEARKRWCPIGHLLTDPNLVASEKKRGIRKCRACAAARVKAFKQDVPFSKQAADDAYARVLSGDMDREQTHCKRGHLLEQPNLVPSSLRNGRRACLACSRAKSYARTRGVPFDSKVAWEKYSELTSAS